MNSIELDLDSTLNNLHRSLQEWGQIPLDIWIQSKQFFYIKKINSQSYFQHQDTLATEVGFVLDGLFRAYFEGPDQKQKGMFFAQTGEFIGAYTSFLSNSKSRLNIIAEKPSTVICVKCENLEKLFKLHPCWQEVGRKLTEKIVKRNENRQYELLVLSATERYEQFLKDFPKLLDQVPQWQIASYLGITPVALSRIRRQRVS